MCLSLARRYNTLDLAGKVSVPRGCGPFGNPVEERRREAGATGRLLHVRDCDGGDSGLHCLPRDHVLWRGVSGLRLGRGATGRGTFCESVTTHYDTFCLPAESSKVPWARALRLWTPGRGFPLHPAQALPPCIRLKDRKPCF